MIADLSPSAWAAIAGVALVGLTAIYVFLTARLSRASVIAAKAAERAAESSERAAGATLEANALHEAEIDVRFEASYFGMKDFGLLVTNRGAAVFVHRVRIGRFAPHDADGHHFDVPAPKAGDECPLWGERPPFRCYRGDYFFCEWPGDSVPLGSLSVLSLEVDFSFRPDGTTEVRDVQVKMPSRAEPKDDETDKAAPD
jgi:hypothetical protein